MDIRCCTHCRTTHTASQLQLTGCKLQSCPHPVTGCLLEHQNWLPEAVRYLRLSMVSKIYMQLRYSLAKQWDGFWVGPFLFSCSIYILVLFGLALLVAHAVAANLRTIHIDSLPNLERLLVQYLLYSVSIMTMWWMESSFWCFPWSNSQSRQACARQCHSDQLDEVTTQATLQQQKLVYICLEREDRWHTGMGS